METGTIGDIDPESIGLYSPSEGGLGAALWKGTPRDLVTQLLPALNLPTYSPLLNNLAQRFLLTTADVPAGKVAGGPSLTSMRVNRLVELGDAKDAWKLIALSKPDLVDEITLRQTAEAGLLSTESTNICSRLPEIIKSYKSPEWQKLLVVCQLMAKDTKAAQLTLDMLHTQNVQDETFFFIAERNIIAANKQLPRQLTPLKPLTLALIKLSDLPLPGEVFAHPDAALIPFLINMKAKDDNARLALADRAAERGLINAGQLEEVYASIAFTPAVLSNAFDSKETGSRLHALLYQAAIQDKTAPKHITLAVKFVETASPAGLNGAQGEVLEDMAGIVPATDENNASSAALARIYIASNKPQSALEWLKQAKHAAVGMPAVAASLKDVWPLAVLSGLELDSDYPQDLSKWLDTTLKPFDPKDNNHADRDIAASLLLLFDADGFAVPEDAWARVLSAPATERHTVPSAALLERLRAASNVGKRGEVVLFSLLLGGANADDPSFLATLDIIRALRLTGLTADAAALARETAARILAPPAKP